MPRVGPRLLNEEYAVFARNARNENGYIQGRNSDVKAADLPPGTNAKFVYRYVDVSGANNFFIPFTTDAVDVVRAPLVNDTYYRVYWAGDGVPPGFNSIQRLRNGDPAYALGVPAPAVAPTVTVGSAGSSPTTEDRAYVYTFVDSFGSEGPPSPPELINARLDDTISVEVPTPGGGVFITDGTPFARVNIYRTVPGISATAFFYVGFRTFVSPYAPVTFTDNVSNPKAALNDILRTTRYFPPNEDIEGLAVMPNGFLAGFEGRNIHFSEPYLPHAWPPQYTLSVEDDVVGLGVFGTNLAIMTTGTPYMASGISPDGMTLDKLGAVNPCLARRSIVAMPDRVLYASEDGLTQISVGGKTNITQDIITRQQWSDTFTPRQIRAVRDGETTYTAFLAGEFGFSIDMNAPDRGIVRIRSDRDVDAFNEDYEGLRPLLVSGDEVYFFNVTDTTPHQAMWYSKEFFLVKPVNFGACQINAVDLAPGTYPAPWTPYVFLSIFADGVQIVNVDAPINTPFKLPSGYKAQVWQFYFTTTLDISRFAIAETEQELADV